MSRDPLEEKLLIANYKSYTAIEEERKKVSRDRIKVQEMVMYIIMKTER